MAKLPWLGKVEKARPKGLPRFGKTKAAQPNGRLATVRSEWRRLAGAHPEVEPQRAGRGVGFAVARRWQATGECGKIIV